MKPAIALPFIPAQKKVPELTPKAILVGLFLAIVFGASSVYLALRAGVTVGGSIPAAVLVIGIFKRLAKSTILENNIVQTIASAGESIASGVVFTTPALIFLAGGDRYFQYSQLTTLAIVGGLLGVLTMIPLRRSLIVKEHGNLRYPEGTACAEVLVAGEQQGDVAKPIFLGSFVAGIYWILMKLIGLWNETPYLLHQKAQDFYPNATVAIGVTPEFLGLGYLIGLKTTLQMLAGSLFAWLVLIPLFSSFPQLASLLHVKDAYTTLSDLGLATVGSEIYPSAGQIYAAYVKNIAVGAVVGAGIITLIRTIPVIVGSFRSVGDTLRNRTFKAQLRTEKDVPIGIVLLGSIILVIIISVLPNLPGTFPGSLLLSGLIIFFGFFFITVSSRFVGVAGYSLDPTSPMMFTTVMVTCLILLLLGWTSHKYQAMAVLIGAVVNIATTNAGATSQDLKTGFLLGSTPYKQQIGLFLGVLLSALVAGATVLLLDHSIPEVSHAIGYIVPGQDTPKFAAPQASILAMLIKAVLGGKMPWGLILLGVALAILVELFGATALSIAGGLYLPVSVTTAIFMGSFIRYIVTRKQQKGSASNEELSKGMLYATGLVAGGALAGMILGFINGFFPSVSKWADLGHEYWKSFQPGGDAVAFLAFILLGMTVYRYAQKDK